MEKYNDYKKEKALSDAVRRCFEFAAKNDLNTLPRGRNEIDGKNLYVNIAEYDTKPIKDCIWEAHKEYIDVQIMLSGHERLYVENINNLKTGEYVPEKDFVPCFGDTKTFVDFQPSVCVALWPDDAHMTGVSDGDAPVHVKKAIFKVKL